jgi:prevent-host-death family protein
MKTATITEAKNGLSALLEQVRAGQSVLILDRGIPVARIEPVPSAGGDQPGRLERLERAGLVRQPTRALDPSALGGPRPRAAEGASALAALLEERQQGR